jgi:hypothetical protein
VGKIVIELNDFQKTTEVRLRGLLTIRRVVGEFSVGGGPKEYAVKVIIGPYVSWIYPDGADVIGQGIDERFEIYDYDSLEQLQGVYLKFVDELLIRIGPAM